ncbi:PREDICTED: glycoprotein 3-alpha-L-fucosyltransferase A-like [Priapulus caudatus]|uniref:Fucosyltransferase n=1 Tax=Priapulus caudatus TaxID=37621 RepID=A0ABM1ECN6_PRICU|nr:PREDICTED: glycoprotein 3-alpha-L-fucosyltransferase A-like [Priapulus caudatus]
MLNRWHQLLAATSSVPAGFKIITFGSSYFWNDEWPILNQTKQFSHCPTRACFIFPQSYYYEHQWLRDTADAVVFHPRDPLLSQKLHWLSGRARPQRQRWITHIHESPLNIDGATSRLRLVCNWTMSYRSDADIYAPYGQFYFNANASSSSVDSVRPDRDYGDGKTGFVAIVVSHCITPNRRELYWETLSKYVPVDVYGLCSKSNSSCTGPQDHPSCMEDIVKRYKFYLAFENSNCREYITEKFWRNALEWDVVPIVRGAPRTDYERSAPPGSFIHVNDFSSVEKLAEYLQELNVDSEAYNKYFRWKQLGWISNNISASFCRLCEALHDVTRPVKSYGYLNQWWNESDCLEQRGFTSVG